jgi:hypothetical protein
MFPRARILSFVLLAGWGLFACRSGERPAEPADRMSALEASLEHQRDAETLVADVEAWIVRASSTSTGAERDRVELLARSLAGRVDRVKPDIVRKSGDRSEAAAFEREISDLRNAFDRALASIPSERRAAEAAMEDEMKEVGEQIAQFRVEVASAGVQTNREARRRATQLDFARREAAQTLGEMRRSTVEQGASLRRRWQWQVRQFRDDYRQASDRVKLMLPEPTPTAVPSPRSRAPVSNN